MARLWRHERGQRGGRQRRDVPETHKVEDLYFVRNGVGEGALHG